jgi:hypothetical protein
MTLETTLPDSIPCRPLDTTATLAAPPRWRPIRALAKSMKKSAPPVTTRATPNSR